MRVRKLVANLVNANGGSEYKSYLAIAASNLPSHRPRLRRTLLSHQYDVSK